MAADIFVPNATRHLSSSSSGPTGAHGSPGQQVTKHPVRGSPACHGMGGEASPALGLLPPRQPELWVPACPPQPEPTTQARPPALISPEGADEDPHTPHKGPNSLTPNNKPKHSPPVSLKHESKPQGMRFPSNPSTFLSAAAAESRQESSPGPEGKVREPALRQPGWNARLRPGLGGKDLWTSPRPQDCTVSWLGVLGVGTACPRPHSCASRDSS